MEDITVSLDEDAMTALEGLEGDFSSRSEAIRTLIKARGDNFGKKLAERRNEREENRRERQAKLASEWVESGV